MDISHSSPWPPPARRSSTRSRRARSSHVESTFNPHAIGVVGGSLERQPRSRDEALATARALQSSGWTSASAWPRSTSRNLHASA